MEMVTNKIIKINGEKDIEVATFEGEKVTFSLLLSFAADGAKLIPILVFKATKGDNLEKSLNTLPIVKNKKIFSYCQPNSWCDNHIFINWMKYIYLSYQNNIIKKNVYLSWIMLPAIVLK